jgi:hypothetical protein
VRTCWNDVGVAELHPAVYAVVDADPRVLLNKSLLVVAVVMLPDNEEIYAIVARAVGNVIPEPAPQD